MTDQFFLGVIKYPECGLITVHDHGDGGIIQDKKGILLGVEHFFQKDIGIVQFSGSLINQIFEIFGFPGLVFQQLFFFFDQVHGGLLYGRDVFMNHHCPSIIIDHKTGSV